MKSKMTMPVLSRRKFLVLTGQGAAAVALASCAGAAPAAPAATNAPVPAAPAKVSGKVEFLAWGDTGDIASWETLQKTYLQKNPDVQLTVTPITDPGNNFYPKLQTSIAGGTPPQVASFQGWEWQVYADKGVLARSTT
jgi:multiple sugar transport system substrate-binding protein